MTVKRKIDPEFLSKLESIMKAIEEVIAEYTNEYADYGWDNFTETMANISAQVYMMKVMSENATQKKNVFG